MLLAVLITTLWLSAIIGVRYLLIAGAVWWMLWGRKAGVGRQLNRDRPSKSGFSSLRQPAAPTLISVQHAFSWRLHSPVPASG